MTTAVAIFKNLSTMGNFYNPYSSKWKAGTKEGNKWKAENAPSLHNENEEAELESDSDEEISKSGIIGIDGNSIKFRVHSKGYVKIKSNNADAFTEKYLNAMALTKISQKVLLEIRDGDKKIEIKDMTQKENDILRKLDDGAFMSISGTVMSKAKYNNLQDYINEKINQEEYEKNKNDLDEYGFTEWNPLKGKKIEKHEKLEQYNEQVILINESAIKSFENSDKEFFLTSLEESIHSTQQFTYKYRDGIQSEEDYLNLPHEKEAKAIVEEAATDYDLKFKTK